LTSALLVLDQLVRVHAAVAGDRIARVHLRLPLSLLVAWKGLRQGGWWGSICTLFIEWIERPAALFRALFLLVFFIVSHVLRGNVVTLLFMG